MLHNIVELDLNPSLRKDLASEKSITTRVHAELQIADQFSRYRTMEFVDGDKYIGCSKPACYFCYNWLDNHKHRYVHPSAHFKIIPGCRGPDTGINHSGAAVLKEMYAKVAARLDQDIFECLLEIPGVRSPKRQFQSTEGSRYAPSRV